MTQIKQLPRFIHLDDQYAVNRYTIAYIRTPEIVYYAFSQLSKHDKYNRKIGREISTERLTKYLQDTSSKEKCYGFVTRADIFERLNFKKEFSDQFLVTLTLMDLKHRVIGNAIIDDFMFATDTY